jgi:hypothetical protein
MCANGSVDAVAALGWYWSFRHRIEAERGLDETADLHSPGSFAIELSDEDAMTARCQPSRTPAPTLTGR